MRNDDKKKDRNEKKEKKVKIDRQHEKRSGENKKKMNET
jgi:hypothetical protein